MRMKNLFSVIPEIKGSRLTLKKLTQADAGALKELVDSESVYRYLPAFLFERRYEDIHYVIEHLYDECLEESLIFGVFCAGEFCGIAEMYGYRAEMHKISVGYRFLERYWGRGIASEALSMMVEYFYGSTNIEIITASSMIENKASACVLKKNGFDLVVHGVDEDWGFDAPVLVDKWIR